MGGSRGGADVGEGGAGSPTWTILIPTLGQRRALFERLLANLLPQLEPYQGRFRVTALWNNGQWPVGVIRQKLLDSLTTDYMSFVDDDDLVADFYAEEVDKAIRQRPDSVGWIAQCYSDGRRWKKAYHSLQYRNWHGGRGKGTAGLYRDFSHTNVIRTDLAQQGRFDVTKPGEAEDLTWVQQLRGKLVREVYVDRVMYHYFHSRTHSTWSQKYGNIDPGPHKRLVVDNPSFAWHPDSFEG